MNKFNESLELNPL